MTARAMLDVVRRTGIVKNGVIVVDGDEPLPEGAEVRIEVESDYSRDTEVPPGVLAVQLDENGELIMTPELEAEIAIGEAEADRGEGTPHDVVFERLRRLR